MIKIISARYLQGYEFALVFSDGMEGVFDLAAYLRSHRGPLLQALIEESYTKQAFVDAGALTWPNGLQLAPRRIYGLCRFPSAA